MSSDLKKSLVQLEKLMERLEINVSTDNGNPDFSTTDTVVSKDAEDRHTAGYIEYFFDLKDKIESALKNGGNGKNVKEIHGDVSRKDGKLEFFGDVHVYGNVDAGAVIAASGQIIVEGFVEDATLNAGGNIVVSGGIIGREACHVAANEDIIADRIDNARIECGGNIFTNAIIGSMVECRGYVLAEGRNGVIAGGSVYALLGVSAAIMGNDMGTVTIVRAGYSDEDYTRYYEFSEKEKKTLDNLSDILGEISDIVKKMRNGLLKNDDNVSEKIEKLNIERDECFKQLDNIRFDLRQLEQIIETGKGRSIIVHGMIYAGTIIEIEGNTFRIPEETRYVRYYNEGTKIQFKILE